ncbi:MAG: ferric reductase-like transmembrane domain-containing protein, partial [Chloroflexota bacterium]
MAKHKLGNWVITLAVAIYVAFWFIFPPEGGIAAQPGDFFGEMLAGSAMILMGTGILLSTKPRWLEPYFGGLDKMYWTHRQVAIIGFLLLIGHFYAIPTGPTPGPGLWLGQAAFFGIVISILLAVAPRVPFISNFIKLSYDKWRIGHRLLGILFLLGIFHYLMVEPLSLATPQGILMMIISVIGVLAWLYKQTLAHRFTPHLQYEVVKTNRLNGSIIELVMKPLGERLQHAAGQFLFIHFEDDDVLKEPHPFTISSPPNADELRISVRNSGDWTGYLFDKVEAGMVASVEGGHGMFDYKASGNDQIWIAGGIGITPFTSWMRDMGKNPSADKKIDFFYTVRSASDVIFFDEFEKTAKDHSNFSAHLRVSNDKGRLTADNVKATCGGNIANRSVYL